MKQHVCAIYMRLQYRSLGERHTIDIITLYDHESNGFLIAKRTQKLDEQDFITKIKIL